MLWLGFFELSLKPCIICHRVILKLKFCFFEPLFQFQSAKYRGGSRGAAKFLSEVRVSSRLWFFFVNFIFFFKKFHIFLYILCYVFFLSIKVKKFYRIHLNVHIIYFSQFIYLCLEKKHLFSIWTTKSNIQS